MRRRHLTVTSVGQQALPRCIKEGECIRSDVRDEVGGHAARCMIRSAASVRRCTRLDQIIQMQFDNTPRGSRKQKPLLAAGTSDKCCRAPRVGRAWALPVIGFSAATPVERSLRQPLPPNSAEPAPSGRTAQGRRRTFFGQVDVLVQSASTEAEWEGP
jgi:hypothetical protein